MKIIDFHTHFFPDNIAKNTIKYLEEKMGIKAYGDGTIYSLKEFMKIDGISLSINLPVATKKEQVISINRKMVEYNKNNTDIICFGSMHPEFYMVGDIEEEIKFLKDNGIKGIKLHPEYQKFYPDSSKLKNIYDICKKYDMIILFHAGKELAYPEKTYSFPERFKDVIKINDLKIVLAHLGGYKLWDGVLKFIVRENVYLDTSFSYDVPDEVFLEIINSHGYKKILFGTDFPWERGKNIIEKINRIVFDEEKKERIFYKNAQDLLKL